MIPAIAGRSRGLARRNATGSGHGRLSRLRPLLSVLLPGLIACAAQAAKETPLPPGMPAYGKDRPLPVARISQSTLPNGLQVWVVPRSGLPRFVARLAVKGGTASDPAEMLGMSQVLADVLKEGTPARTSKQIAETLQSVGAEISSSVSDDAFFLDVNGLSSGAGTMLEILGDVARHASFPDSEVELAKTNTIQSILTRESDPGFLASRALSEAVFGDHPYRLVSPTRAVVESITPEVLRREFARRFRPDRSLLVIVGPWDANTALKETKKIFSSWKGEGTPVAPVPQAPSATNHRIIVVDRPGSVQSEIRVGRPVPRPSDPDHYPLLLANTILGGSGTSRMYENIREDKGYTYTPYSDLSDFAQGGMFLASAAVRNEVTAATLLEIDYELDRLGATTPTPAEMERAKRFQTGIYLLRNETRGGLARTLAEYWAEGLDAAALTDFVPRVNAVTPDQVRMAGRRYLPSRDQAVAIVADADSVKADLEQFGDVEVGKGAQ
jgi:predicted Zn-dependent peptidase